METTRRWGDDDADARVVVVVRGCRQSLWRATLTYAMVTMSVASGTTATMSVLTRELKFSERPEALNGYYASAFAVSALKPAWAWASDNNNNAGGRRRGRRRRRRRRAMHAAIGCVMASVASVGTATCRSEGMAYVWGMLASAGTSYAYAATDGYVVERAGRERKDAVATQSLAMGSRTFGSLCGEAVSAVTLAMVSARVGMLACAGWFACSAACAWFVLRDDDDDDGDEDDVSRNGAVEAVEKSDGDEGDASCSDARFPSFSLSACASWLRETYAPLATPTYARCLVAVFVYRVAPTALDTYGAYVYSAFENIVPNWGFSVVSLFSSLGALLAPIVFGWMLSGDSSRRWFRFQCHHALMSIKERLTNAPTWLIFVLAAACDAILGLCRLFIVWWPPSRGGGAVASLALTDAVSTFGLRVGYMPIVTLAAMVAPRDIEAVGFATIILASDIGALVAAGLAAGTTKALNLGAPTSDASSDAAASRSWNALPTFLLLVAAFKALIPLIAMKPILDAHILDDDRNASTITAGFQLSSSVSADDASNRRLVRSTSDEDMNDDVDADDRRLL